MYSPDNIYWDSLETPSISLIENNVIEFQETRVLSSTILAELSRDLRIEFRETRGFSAKCRSYLVVISRLSCDLRETACRLNAKPARKPRMKENTTRYTIPYWCWVFNLYRIHSTTHWIFDFYILSAMSILAGPIWQVRQPLLTCYLPWLWALQSNFILEW